MEYGITKQQCLKSINGVCSQCGGDLEPIETVDNAGNPTWWSGCKRCYRFDNGVAPDIYLIAKELVEKCHYRPYRHHVIEDSDNADVRQYKNECQIGDACTVIRDVLRIRKKLSNK